MTDRDSSRSMTENDSNRSMTLWTSQEISRAVGGEVSADFTCGGVAFDSREIVEGDLFLALKGEQSDGHHYVDIAMQNGASGAIVSEAIDSPHILVADTTAALNDLAHAARARCHGVIIGVTGSAGKTGTKEALFEALDRSSLGKAHRSVKSYNNHVGVPLSLCRMPSGSAFGIFEMGMNHSGELRALSAIVRPHIAIITTIAPAHIEFFKNEAEIAAAKAEIFEGVMDGGTAIIPYDNPHYEQLRSAAARQNLKILSFGMSDQADVYAVDVVKSGTGSLITAQIGDTSLVYSISQAGDHWVANSLAVMAAVKTAGGDLASAGLALADMAGLAGRGAQHELQYQGKNIWVKDESYNANPSSMRVTIAQLGSTEAKRRVAILGTMGELGDKSARYHLEIATHLQDAKIDYAILVGEEMKILAKQLQSGVEHPAKYDHCNSSTEAMQLYDQNIEDGDVILVKGSNFLGLGAIVKKLQGGGN